MIPSDSFKNFPSESGPSKEPKLNVLTTHDIELVQYFKDLDDHDLNDFINRWQGVGCDINTLMNNLPSPLSQQGAYEIIKVFAEKRPRAIAEWVADIGIEDQKILVELAKICKDAKNIEYFEITSENDRAEIAKLCIREGSPDDALKNFKNFSIHDSTLLKEICETLTEARPDLFMENFKLFSLDKSFENELIAKCLPHASFYTAGKVRDLINAFQTSTSPEGTLSLSPDRIKRKDAAFSDVDKKIVSFFKKIAENHRMGVLTQSPHSQIEAYLRQPYDLLTLTGCGMTSVILLNAIFGEAQKTNLISLNFIPTNENLSALISLIKKNGAELDELPPTHFFAYSIGSKGLDHVIVVIQNRDESHKIQYRLLQSWVKQHDLQDYMENRTNALNESEFFSFFEEFRHVLLHPTWTHQKALFYNRYFMYRPGFAVGKLHPPQKELIIKYGPSSLDEMKLLDLQRFKEMHHVIPMKGEKLPVEKK